LCSALMGESAAGQGHSSKGSVGAEHHDGALWPYIQDRHVYWCPRGWIGCNVTYAIVAAARGNKVEGTFVPLEKDGDEHKTWDMVEYRKFGKRIGSTVLRLTRLTDIISPGAAQRAVFLDQGHRPDGSDFEVSYLYPRWKANSPPPVHHRDGTTLSMADGHVDYWRWKGRETVEMPRTLWRSVMGPDGPHLIRRERLEGNVDYEPRTEDGLYDLQKLQKATWGRLGY